LKNIPPRIFYRLETLLFWSQRYMYTNKQFLRQIAIRVTRLGEFSPFGWFVYFRPFFENHRSSRNYEASFFQGKSYFGWLFKLHTEVAKSFGLRFFLGKNYGLILAKERLGDFSTNASGHSDRNQRQGVARNLAKFFSSKFSNLQRGLLHWSHVSTFKPHSKNTLTNLPLKFWSHSQCTYVVLTRVHFFTIFIQSATNEKMNYHVFYPLSVCMCVHIHCWSTLDHF
jgi:hypothetical protein